MHARKCASKTERWRARQGEGPIERAERAMRLAGRPVVRADARRRLCWLVRMRPPARARKVRGSICIHMDSDSNAIAREGMETVERDS
eukprot:6175559-Pleurochrysis_carterae.AAC.2